MKPSFVYQAFICLSSLTVWVEADKAFICLSCVTVWVEADEAFVYPIVTVWVSCVL